MKEFYFAYYLVLFGIYLLLPVLFWLLSHRSRQEESRVVHRRRELRGHFVVCLALSAIMLSFVPWPLATLQEAKGVDQFMAGFFTLVFVGAASFFIWIGVKQAGVNRRTLRDEHQQKLKKPCQLD